MSDLTNFAENKLIDALLRGQAIGTPATWYVALFTTTPGEDGTGGTECSGTGYARVGVSAATSAWSGTQSAGSTTASSGTGGRSSNNATIDFGTAGGSNWGTIVGFGLYDASSSGNLWLRKALTTSKAINSGDPVSFQADALGITIA